MHVTTIRTLIPAASALLFAGCAANVAQAPARVPFQASGDEPLDLDRGIVRKLIHIRISP